MYKVCIISPDENCLFHSLAGVLYPNLIVKTSIGICSGRGLFIYKFSRKKFLYLKKDGKCQLQKNRYNTKKTIKKVRPVCRKKYRWDRVPTLSRLQKEQSKSNKAGQFEALKKSFYVVHKTVKSALRSCIRTRSKSKKECVPDDFFKGRLKF